MEVKEINKFFNKKLFFLLFLLVIFFYTKSLFNKNQIIKKSFIELNNIDLYILPTNDINLENNSLFSFQSKRFMGAHVDYKFNQDFILGASALNLTEKPLTQKINIGDEPISNTIVGVPPLFQFNRTHMYLE